MVNPIPEPGMLSLSLSSPIGHFCLSASQCVPRCSMCLLGSKNKGKETEVLRDDGEKADFYLGRERDWCQGVPDSVLIPCLPSPTWLGLHLEDGEPGNTGQEQTVPGAPQSKSCGSKQAVAPTESLPAPGWARPPGSIICSVGMWERQEHPTAQSGDSACVQKRFGILLGIGRR